MDNYCFCTNYASLDTSIPTALHIQQRRCSTVVLIVASSRTLHAIEWHLNRTPELEVIDMQRPMGNAASFALAEEEAAQPMTRGTNSGCFSFRSCIAVVVLPQSCLSLSIE